MQCASGRHSFESPKGFTLHSATGDLFIVDHEDLSIRRLDSLFASISLVAGRHYGFLDSKNPLEAQFKQPWGIAVDQRTGRLFVSDHGNHCIRAIDEKTGVSTFAGQPTVSGFSDGLATVPCGADASKPLSLSFIPPVVSRSIRKERCLWRTARTTPFAAFAMGW